MISEECLLPKLLVLVDMVVFLVHLYNNKHSYEDK